MENGEEDIENEQMSSVSIHEIVCDHFNLHNLNDVFNNDNNPNLSNTVLFLDFTRLESDSLGHPSW
jgi:hypothetical protein